MVVRAQRPESAKGKLIGQSAATVKPPERDDKIGVDGGNGL
jgi:hypothetical protein